MGAPVALQHRDYGGLITRGIAFVIDCAIVNAIALIVAAATLLALSVLPGGNRLHGLAVVLAGLAYVLWCIAYFATFWATTGQTPGDRVMRVRVRRLDGGRVGWAQAVLRVGASVLAALPLLLGFLPIVFTPQRRGLHDWLAGTVVTRAADEEPLPTPVVRPAASAPSH